MTVKVHQNQFNCVHVPNAYLRRYHCYAFLCVPQLILCSDRQLPKHSGRWGVSSRILHMYRLLWELTIRYLMCWFVC